MIYYKPFNLKLFQEHDHAAKVIVSNYLNSVCIPTKANPDIYGIDLLSTDNSIGIEVEHNLFWTRKINNTHVNIFARKSKYFLSTAYSSSMIVFLDKPMTTLCLLNGSHIRYSIQSTSHTNLNLYNHNSNSNQLDSVYRVPMKYCKYVNL